MHILKLYRPCGKRRRAFTEFRTEQQKFVKKAKNLYATSNPILSQI